MKNLKKLAGWTGPDWHTMDVSTEDDGRDITWYTEMVRTLPHALSNEKSLCSRAQVPRYNILDMEFLGWPKASDCTRAHC